jgi:hypothetical protein
LVIGSATTTTCANLNDAGGAVVFLGVELAVVGVQRQLA